MPEVILRLPAVKARIGLTRSSIYQLIFQGRFPRPIVLGQRSVGYLNTPSSLAMPTFCGERSMAATRYPKRRYSIGPTTQYC
jgi:prophage regulatory protein